MTPRALLVLVLAAALAACASPAKPAAPAAKPAEKKKSEAAAAAPAVTESSLLDYSYTPIGKRDPFRSLLEDVAERAQELPGRVDCGPLCKWEIEQFKLVAVISGISNPLAMVEAPGGKGYVVRRGTFMGKRNGKIVQIRAGEIVVAEIFKDQKGQPHVNQQVIKLPADKNQQQVDEANLLGPEVAE